MLRGCVKETVEVGSSIGIEDEDEVRKLVEPVIIEIVSEAEGEMEKETC